MLLYVGLAVCLLQIVIVFWEEPVLRARFGDAYERYMRTVPRWLLPKPASGGAGIAAAGTLKAVP